MPAVATATRRSLSYWPGWGLLDITQDGETSSYHCRRVSPAFAPVTEVEVEKLLSKDGVPYRVQAGPDGWSHCTCRGFRYHGKCRHAAAVAVLVSKGHFQD